MIRHFLTTFFITGLLIVCSQCKSSDERFVFTPPTDSIFHFTIHITDSGVLPGSITIKKQGIEFALQKTGEKNGLQVMNLVIGRLQITAPGITMAETKKGSIVVLPAGTMVTLSTDDVDTDNITASFNRGYYTTWLRILPMLRGDSLQIVMNRRGEVQEVSGFERIADRIANESGTDRRIVQQYLGDYIGNESVRDLLNQLFFYLPGRKIRQGDRWVKNVTLNEKAPVKQSHLITATEINKEQNTVRMSVQSVISAKTSEGGRLYAEGALTGGIVADYSSGMFHKLFLTQQVTTHNDQYDVVRKRIIETHRF